MKRLAAAIVAVVLPCAAGATTLEEKPWFGPMCEFNFRAQYNCSFYDKVNRALVQLKSTSHDHLVAAGVGMTYPDDWNWQAEVDFFESPRSSFGWRSFAVSARKRFLDDVSYDPVSLTAGATVRTVSKCMLRDVSVPFHARGNFEIHAAIGKEWSHGSYWDIRLFGLGAVGIGTKGLPWVRSDLHIMGNWCDCLQGSLYGCGYFGLGRKKVVNIETFDGWGNIHHQSIDLGGSVKFFFRPWGSLRFDYSRRIYAYAFPENVSFFTLTYQLPFSPF